MKRKMTTTKKVLLFTLLACCILEFVIIGAWVLFDKEDAPTLAGVIASPAAIVIGFYEWKAKCENMSKYANTNQDTEAADIKVLPFHNDKGDDDAE